MKILYIFLPLLVTTVLSGRENQLRVVEDVDLEKYAGIWYEIARLPNPFQRKCAGDVSAQYTLLDNGQIKVVNRCRLHSGEFTESEGRARRADDNGPNSKLKVRFAPRILSWLPFVWGDYWIIELDPEYRYSVVGDPKRKYLWILARDPEMDDDEIEAILGRAEEQGYDVTDIIKTKHTAS